MTLFKVNTFKHKAANMARLSIILCALFVAYFAAFVEAYTKLSDDTLRAISGPGDDFNIKTGKLLAPILRPRVPGTPGSTAVLNHLADFFKTNLPKWQIAFQNSTAKTPATGNKDVPFINMIASRDPPWTSPGDVGRLTLVAHYDSKITPTGFIGATDSAAPCAMLMHAARSVDAALTKKWAAMQAEGIGKQDYVGMEEYSGIQIMFLDGEEAFKSWTDEDSLYGSRSLAAEMEATSHGALSTYQTAISSISLFVLLDLLGAKNPNVPSFFETTHWAYRHMATLEQRLRSLSLFLSASNHPSKHKTSIKADDQVRRKEDKRQDPAFLPESDKKEGTYRFGSVSDDHIPFMARGVEVLHIIPLPFPRVWHHMDDDGKHLDLDTCSDWAVLVTAFVGEWMDLEGYLGKNDVKAVHKRGIDERGRQKIISKTEL